MGKIRLGFLLCGMLVVGGCALSPEERQQIIESSSEIAAEKASRIAFEKARGAGLSVEDAEKVADLARSESRKVVEGAVNRLIPQAESDKKSKWGAAIGSILVALLQMAAAMAKKSA